MLGFLSSLCSLHWIFGILSNLSWFSCISVANSPKFLTEEDCFLSHCYIFLLHTIWRYFLCHYFDVQVGQRTRRPRTSTIARLRLAGFSECSRRSSVTPPYSTQERAEPGRYLKMFIHTKPWNYSCMSSSCIHISHTAFPIFKFTVCIFFLSIIDLTLFPGS